MDPIIEQLRGKVICQLPGIYGRAAASPRDHGSDGRACELGGAGGIRCQGLSDIAALKGRTEVPSSASGRKATRASTSRPRCVMRAPV